MHLENPSAAAPAVLECGFHNVHMDTPVMAAIWPDEAA
jgi:hypothetical protein